MSVPSSDSLRRPRVALTVGLLVGLCVLGWRSHNHAEPVPFPLEVRAALEGNQLRVAIDRPKAEGTELTLEVLDRGTRVGTLSKVLGKDDDFLANRFPAIAVDPSHKNELTLRFRIGGRVTQDVPLSHVLLARAHETTLLAGRDYYAGSQASLQCTVRGIKSIAEAVPAAATVRLRLREASSGKTHDLREAKTDARGTATVAFDVPDLPAGSYTLEVTTSSALGEEKLEQPVQLKRDGKILLVSDKPIYQPGQLIHLRALALHAYTMRPLANKDLVFEVEDSKGNKVFKKSLKTSDFGVASVDFQLADEVNMGNYSLRASSGDLRAEKTVEVKRYVLPKFKAAVTTDKAFYLPKETIKAELQSDYFFGKPVAKAKVEVTASTFDVAFREFHKWTGTTDEQGHAKFEVKLPDYFVGQPLQKGNALVKLDVQVLDTADHTEKIVKSLTVSDQPIKISLLPEGGKLAPGLENRIFAAALYPDGSPAGDCQVQLWLGKEAKGEPLATLKTSASGLAEFKIKPEPKDFRTTGHGPRQVEMLGGIQQSFGPQHVLDLRAQAQDARGAKAVVTAELSSQPFGENVLLRLDKAIYQAGDRLTVDVRSSAGLPTAYVDIVRGGQILLSTWTDVKDGKAEVTLDVPPTVFGSLEVHAYQMLHHGEIIRDSRVVYVQPRTELKIDVQNVKAEYEPGAAGRLRFVVTDAAGKPTAAALGVIIVDEAVYALQDLQPGLEKLYFTLQEELLKPQVQLNFGPRERIDQLVLQPGLPAPRQQIAEVLLTAVKLPAPKRWSVDPEKARRQQVRAIVQQIGANVFAQALTRPFLTVEKSTGTHRFRPEFFADIAKSKNIPQQFLRGPFGETLTLADLEKIEPGFNAEKLAYAVTAQRMQQILQQMNAYIHSQRGRYFRNGRWTFDDAAMAEAARLTGLPAQDAWGKAFKITPLEKADPQLAAQFDLRSAGPDGVHGTKDDLHRADVYIVARFGWMGQVWWLADESRLASLNQGMLRRRGGMLREQFQIMDGRADRFERNLAVNRLAMPRLAGAPGLPMPMNAPPAMEAAAFRAGPAVALDAKAQQPTSQSDAGSPAPITKIREYFPETMLWQPNLITDDKGLADLGIDFADSITTWRLSASANSLNGFLGNTTMPLKVFQDFFVDLDLPVALTQNDEIAFPVAVYNYLKTPQTVKLELQQEPWFTLLGDDGLTRSLDLKPGEVTSVRYRIKAGKIGFQPLLVKAYGSKKSDAVKRLVEVVPDGEKKETIVTDRLQGTVRQTITLPTDAVPDASKLLVRIYPGVMAQVIEGMEGILRLPGGCFEQTSSSAYPNILAVDYIKKSRLANPQLLMKAENFLNVGYQRLLTFERPGGGFDWWGSGEPLVWLSAYGLQEFSDMARVYPIDRGIIDRTQAFLLKKMDKDGTWSNIGATHGETIASMGNAKLLLTSYVTWSLLESGYDRKQLAKSVQFIRDNLAAAGDSAYILALAANALAAYDAKDDSTFEAIRALEKLRKDVPDWRAVNYPGRTTSLTYARGDAVTVETTALAVLAMLKTGQFTASANKGLTYLVKVKGDGHWGSTQATILALKALLAGMGGNAVTKAHPFTIKLNGKEVAQGKVDVDNAELMQTFDLREHTRSGENLVEIDMQGETSLMYQILGRHYQPWSKQPAVAKAPVVSVDVTYDRTKLSTHDLLHAKATLKYMGPLPTYNVIVDLGIAPGFTVDAGEFAEMVAKKTVARFTVTSRQVTLYLGDVRPGDVRTFEYTLKPKYPLRAQAPGATAWEYYTPANRAESRPVEITVVDR